VVNSELSDQVAPGDLHIWTLWVQRGNNVSHHMSVLVKGINLWRSKKVSNYWLNVGYMGAAINRLGDHDLTMINGQLYHEWNGAWRKIEMGSDYWLFSIPGTFAWARDMIEMLDEDDPGLEIACNEMYGYVEFLRVRADHRDEHNFTFEVRRFGQGAPLSFKE
jgi:hypothetical protein